MKNSQTLTQAIVLEDGWDHIHGWVWRCFLKILQKRNCLFFFKWKFEILTKDQQSINNGNIVIKWPTTLSINVILKYVSNDNIILIITGYLFEISTFQRGLHRKETVETVETVFTISYLFHHQIFPIYGWYFAVIFHND